MEIKKSKKADLERGRLVRWLVGLVLASALFLAALEVPLGGVSSDDGDEAEEELLEEMDLSDLHPKRPDDEMKALLPKTLEQPREVEDTPAEGKEMEPVPEQANAAKTDSADLKKDPEQEPPVAVLQGEPLDFRVVQDLPEYPGGPVAFMKWLTKNLRYPKAAQQQKVQGKVVAQFVVAADGSITELKITQSLHPLCDREALRVLQLMPKWKPGVQNDKPCATMVAIPIVFQL